jgi:hypothetical protein
MMYLTRNAVLNLDHVTHIQETPTGASVTFTNGSRLHVPFDSAKDVWAFMQEVCNPQSKCTP